MNQATKLQYLTLDLHIYFKLYGSKSGYVATRYLHESTDVSRYYGCELPVLEPPSPECLLWYVANRAVVNQFVQVAYNTHAYIRYDTTLYILSLIDMEGLWKIYQTL